MELLVGALLFLGTVVLAPLFIFSLFKYLDWLNKKFYG
jgi:hypothetical protein